MFNLAAYLGAVVAKKLGYFFLIGSTLSWFGMFMPGVMLIFAVMPFWNWFRKYVAACMVPSSVGSYIKIYRRFRLDC